MLLSLLVYLGTAILLYLLAKNYVNRNKSHIRRFHNELPFVSFEVLFSLFLFALVAGLRYNTGVDHLSYLEDYLRLSEGNYAYHNYEYLFQGLMMLFAQNGIHYSFFFGFCAFIQLFFIYYALRYHKDLLPYVGLYIMLGPLFLTWMNGVRQSIVVCLFFCMSGLLINKRFVWYIIGVIGASFIHKSALFLMPIILVAFVPINWFYNTKRNLIILGICILFGLTPFWVEYITPLQSLLEKIGYISYALGLDDLVSETNFQETAFGPGRMMLLALDIILLLMFPKVSGTFKDRMIDQSFILYYIGTCVYNLFVNTSHIFLRPVSYLTIFILVILPASLLYLKSKRRYIKYYALSLLAYMYIIYIVFRAWYLVGYNSTDLYHFFFV